MSQDISFFSDAYLKEIARRLPRAYLMSGEVSYQTRGWGMFKHVTASVRLSCIIDNNLFVATAPMTDTLADAVTGCVNEILRMYHELWMGDMLAAAFSFPSGAGPSHASAAFETEKD